MKPFPFLKPQKNDRVIALEGDDPKADMAPLEQLAPVQSTFLHACDNDLYLHVRRIVQIACCTVSNRSDSVTIILFGANFQFRLT